MAGKLRGVIRLNRWNVDEARRRLGQILRARDDLERRARDLETQLGAEQKIAAVAPVEGGLLYGNYARWVIERRRQLAAAIDEIEKNVAAVREQLREAYRELKKYEVAEAARERQKQKELDRREQFELDEVGAQGARRRRAQT